MAAGVLSSTARRARGSASRSTTSSYAPIGVRVTSSPIGSSPRGAPTGSRPSRTRARSLANTATPIASVPTMASGAASSNSSNFGGPVGIGASWRRSVGLKSRSEPPSFTDTLHTFQGDFAHPDGVGCHFDALVLAHELQRLIQRELARRHEPHENVRGGGAHVGQVLLFHRVDVEILLAGVLAHDH